MRLALVYTQILFQGLVPTEKYKIHVTLEAVTNLSLKISKLTNSSLKCNCMVSRPHDHKTENILSL